MEPPTVTSETVEEATIYEKPKKSKKKMSKTKKTLPRKSRFHRFYQRQGAGSKFT